MAKKNKVPTADATALTSNPFAKLADLGVAPASTEEPAADSPAPAQSEPVSDDREIPGQPAVRRAVVSYQRKGRGGKEVTALELRGLRAADLGPWLNDLKKRLGCGGFLEDDLIVLSGDQRQRLQEFLERAGIAKISVS